MRHLLFAALAIAVIITGNVNAKPNEKKDLKPTAGTPVNFIENKGQITDQHGGQRGDIDCKLEAGGVVMFVGNGQLHYQWTKTSPRPSPQVEREQKGGRANSPSPFMEKGQGDEVSIYRMDVTLVGADRNVKPSFEQPADYYEQYYTAGTGITGATAHAYSKVTYKNIYPGIDWVLYVKNGVIKYDFVVHENGNAANIRLRYDGATELKLHDGALTATTPYGSITEEAPYTYDAITKQQVPSSYKLEGNVLSFVVEQSANKLIIDPTLEWATYYGGSPGGHEHSMTGVDDNEDVYLCGESPSTNNIATNGAHKTTITGIEDCYLAKFNKNGVRQWGTYFGGADWDQIASIYVTPGGNVYLGGVTGSTGIATSAAHQTQKGYGLDGFITKFSSSGQLLWSTYYGGREQDNVYSITGDQNYIYVAGGTKSDTGISTPGSHKPVYINAITSNSSDGFVAKFDHSGKRIWSTYYGGMSIEECFGVCLDNAGNIIVTGTAGSDTGIASAGAYDKTMGVSTKTSTGGDAFIAKFDNTGKRLWGSYYGGEASDYGVSVITDKQNNIYIAGGTNSRDSIATLNKKSAFYNGSAYLSKFTPGGVLLWGQYINIINMTSTPPPISGSYLAKDSLDHIYLSGTVFYDSAKSDPCFYYPYSIPASRNNANTFGLIACDTAGTIYNWINFGGNHHHRTSNIAVYKNESLYYAGYTPSTVGIATPSAHQTTIPFSNIAASCLFKFSLDTNVYLQPVPDSLYCKGDVFDLKYVVTKNFRSGNTFSVQLSDATGSFASPITIGSINSITSGVIACTIPANIVQSDKYKLRIVSTSPSRTPCTQSSKIKIGVAIPDAISFSSNTPICRNDTLKLFASSSTTGATFTWTGPDNYSSVNPNSVIPNVDTYGSFKYILESSMYGCTEYDTTTVVVNQYPVAPVATSNSPVCANDTLTLKATTTTTGVSYQWTGPNSFSSALQNPVSYAPTLTAGDYIVAATKDGCARRDTIAVQLKPIPANQTISSNSPICAVNDTLRLGTSSTTTGQLFYNWFGPDNYSSTLQNPVLYTLPVSASGKYIAAINLNGCIVKDTVEVTVKPKPAISLSANAPLCLGSTLNLTASSATGTSFNWWGPASFSSTQQNPSIANMTAPQAGVYKAITTLNGCISDTGNVNVTFFSSTPKPVAISNSPICTGQDLKLSAPAIAGATYRWWGPAGFTALTQNPTRNISGLNQGGDYYVTATVNGCVSDTEKITVVVNWAPKVNMVALSDTILCQGETASFIAAGVNAGTPQYMWFVNGIPTGNRNMNYTSTTLSTGDKVSCVMTASPGLCGSLYNDTSNIISMTVYPVLPASVSISSNPAHPLFENEMITFTAKPVNGGSNPIYQWKRNGKNESGATGSSWGANANRLTDGDMVCVFMKSNYECPNPDTATSNCIRINIKVGIDEVYKNNDLLIYPNPFADELHISKTEKWDTIQLTDVMGRIVYEWKNKNGSAALTINTSALIPGYYILKSTDQDGNRAIHNVVKQ